MSSPNKSSDVSCLGNAPNPTSDVKLSATASISMKVTLSPQPDVPWSPQTPNNHHLLAIVSLDHRESALHFFYANRIVALDCEMVGVGPGGQRSVLARVSLVDFFGNCIVDTFVRVEEQVTDYRTSISGVEAHNLTSSWAGGATRTC
jgi:hypothetical protein